MKNYCPPQTPVRVVLKDKLEKGIISEELHNSALEELKVLEGTLKKGGEGSKVGEIISHTKSGKPIYASVNHPSHSNFTEADHEDAVEVHQKERNLQAHNSPSYINHQKQEEEHEKKIPELVAAGKLKKSI